MKAFRSRSTALLFAALALGCGPAPRPAAVVAPAPPVASAEPRAERDEPAPAAPLHVASSLPPPGPELEAAAHLATTSCAEDRASLEGRIAAMRVAVAAELARWKKAQPGCWAEYRRRAEEERELLRQNQMVYGLGLSGIGEGGGGYGEGIGLGHVGSIGHGARTAKLRSRTNVQVEGVDEADLVKTDGRYVYLAVNGALRIVEALNPRVVSVTKLPGDARELFVEGDRAVVYTSRGGHAKRCTYAYDCAVGGDGSSTRVTVLDLASRDAPRVTRTIELSGSLVAARRIGHAVHTVVADGDDEQRRRDADLTTWPPGLDECGTPEATVRARFAALVRDNERRFRETAPKYPTMVDRGVATELCATILRSSFDDGAAFTSVVSFDMTRDDAAPVTASIQARPGIVFAGRESLYLAVARRGRHARLATAEDDASAVHAIRIGADPKSTRYLASGVVPGHALSQLALDERDGALRIATTRGRVPDPKAESAVTILVPGPAGTLVRAGSIDHLAPGEDLRAVRFDDDRAYVVTFKKTDPLFVLDLADPKKPSVLGELKIPGFSTYLHRLDRDHLLAIGYDADDHGDFAYFDGLLLQLFDVSTPTRPKLLHREVVGSRGSSSEALGDHLAFTYVPETGLLALPATVCEGGGDGVAGRLAFGGLLLYRVGLESGFSRLGAIDHGSAGATCQSWWSHPESAVKRSVVVDDLVYSIALDRAKVQRMGALGRDVADLAFTP
jgi:hypothetical protein